MALLGIQNPASLASVYSGLGQIIQPQQQVLQQSNPRQVQNPAKVQYSATMSKRPAAAPPSVTPVVTAMPPSGVTAMPAQPDYAAVPTQTVQPQQAPVVTDPNQVGPAGTGVTTMSFESLIQQYQDALDKYNSLIQPPQAQPQSQPQAQPMADLYRFTRGAYPGQDFYRPSIYRSI